MRLLGYIRCSDDDKGERHSVEQQEAVIQRYCDAFGYALVDVIVDDGVSGGTDLNKRAGGGELMERLREAGAEGVVCRDIDRMFRMAVDGLVTASWFNRRGLAIHCVNQKIDTATADGWLSLTVKLAIAEYERNKTRERNKQVSDHLKSAGKVYGQVPYGCVAVDGMLYRHPGFWAQRDMIVCMRTKQDMSFQQIVNALQADGVPNPSGKKFWHKSTLKNLVASHDEYKHIALLPSDVDTEVSA